jgi:hypothetical protein
MPSIFELAAPEIYSTFTAILAVEARALSLCLWAFSQMLFVLITKHIFQQVFLACERHHTQEILFSVLANLKVYSAFTALL